MIREEGRSRLLGLHEEDTGMKQPQGRKEPQIIKDRSEQHARYREEAHNEGSWAKLRTLNFILSPKGSHQKIIRKTFFVTKAVRRIRNMLGTNIWGRIDFPMLLKPHGREPTLPNDTDIFKDKIKPKNTG